MQISKQPQKYDTMHVIRRKTKAGEERMYNYKLFRVIGPDGNVTTVSMDPIEHVEVRARYKVDQRKMADTVRAAARHLIETKALREGHTFSSQVLAVAVRMLEAERLGVSFTDFEHARANNDAWQ